MTTTNIILTILSSSLISALLTSLANIFLNKATYKNEYYKKILDKRITAYEEIETLLIRTKSLTFDEENNLIYSQFFDTTQKLDEHILLLAFASKNNLWISSEISELLTEMNMFLIQIQKDIGVSENPEMDVRYFGHDNINDIRVIRKKISDQLKIDLQNLHDIDSFLKVLNCDEEKHRKRYRLH